MYLKANSEAVGQGEPAKLGGVYSRPAMPSHRALASKLFPLIEKLLKQRRLHPVHYELRPGGLDGITDGIEHIRRGQVQNGKLVYSIN